MATLESPLKFICSISCMLQGEMGPDGAKGERGEPGMTVSGDPLGQPRSEEADKQQTHTALRKSIFAFGSVLHLCFKFRRTKSDSMSARR